MADPALPPDAVHPLTRAEWRAWLEKNHDRAKGVWLVMYKKATGKAQVNYNDAVEEALCYGWIDSKGGKLDNERTMLWLTPRKPGSKWSKLNKTRVEQLVQSGLMTPTGRALIDEAQRDGSWTSQDAIEALEIPDDLAQALAANPQA